MPTAPVSSTQRIQSLDLFRYLTVTFALFSHALIFLRVDSEGAGNFLLLKSLTRTATPSLLILFGVMAELIYVRRARMDAGKASFSLLRRAIICYLCYFGLVLLAFLGGDIGAGQAAKAVTMAAQSPYANIFKIYALLLPITILLIRWRIRHGLGALWLGMGAVWLADTLLLDRLPPVPGLTHLGGLLFGIGPVWGPSLLHGLTLVVAGMTIARAIFSPGPQRKARIGLVALTLCSILLLADPLHRLGLHAVLERISDIAAWRSDNDIHYYAYGVLASLLLIALSKTVCVVAPAALTRLLTRIGRFTLSYFFIGNAVLLLLPSSLGGLPPGGKVVFVTLFLAFCGWATLAWTEHRHRLPLADLPEEFSGRAAGALLRRLTPAGTPPPEAHG